MNLSILAQKPVSMQVLVGKNLIICPLISPQAKYAISSNSGLPSSKEPPDRSLGVL